MTGRVLRSRGSDADGLAASWGVDVSTRALHAVAIDDAGRIAAREVAVAGRLDEVAALVAGAEVVAVDAPSGWSGSRHRSDTDLPPKFRTARCGEVGLRAQHGYAVPWPTPAGPGERTAWMEVGIALHRRLSPHLRTVETFPHAAFLHLAGERRLPRKSSPAGRERRAAVLTGHVDADAGELASWSADHLDALVAAVVARDVARGRSTVARCDAHPDTAPIHLPAVERRPR